MSLYVFLAACVVSFIIAAGRDLAKKRISKLSPSQARIALMAIADGKSLLEALEIAGSPVEVPE